METTQRSTVVGIFDDFQQAERAVDALHLAGFSDEQIGFIRRSGETTPGTSHLAGDPAPSTGAGIGTGAVIGGLIGAAAALLIPGVGPVLAGGILVNVVGATAVGGAVVGAVGGAVAGGLLGALTDMGVPEDEARYADEQFQAGRTIVTVKTAGRAGEASETLHRFGAHDVRAERVDTTTPPAPPQARRMES